MKKINNTGFTLIEIVVVMIIIGVLAAIALPNLFNNVTRSRGSTAVAAMDGIKSQLEACAAQNNTTVGLTTGTCTPTHYGLAYSNGFTFGIGGENSISTSAQSTTSGFVVQSAGKPSAGNLNYSIEATDAAGNVISITRYTNGTFVCTPPTSGPYVSVCGTVTAAAGGSSPSPSPPPSTSP